MKKDEIIVVKRTKNGFNVTADVTVDEALIVALDLAKSAIIHCDPDKRKKVKAKFLKEVFMEETNEN